MYTCTLYGLVRMLIWITVLGICVTEVSQTHTVCMCSHDSCNLDAVKCESGYIITIEWLYYDWYFFNRPYGNCPDCCQDTDWGDEETGTHLVNLKNTCNDKQACRINSEIMDSWPGQWRAKIRYICNPQSTTSTSTTFTTTVSTSTLITANTTITVTPRTTPAIPPPTTRSVSVATATITSISKTTTKETTGRAAEGQNHNDDFPTTAVAISVPVVLVVVGVVIAFVVCFARKRGHTSEKSDNVSTHVGNVNSSNLIAMDTRTYADLSVDEDHSYAYITKEHTEFDSEYVETSDFNTRDDGNYTNAMTVNVQNNDNYGHISRQSSTIDNTYSHITTKQPANVNADANYSHIAGVHGLNHGEVVGADPSDNNDITYTILSGTDKTTKDELTPPYINDEDEGYNHTHFVRSSDKKLNNVTESNGDGSDEYNHTTFTKTLDKNEDEDE